MVQQVLDTIDDDRLSVHVVWMPVLPTDTRASADDARTRVTDPRAIHYWDGDQSLGLTYGKVVRLPRGAPLAWDVYFAYGGAAHWGDDPPAPAEWAHQLGMDDRHLGDGDRLRSSIRRLLDG